MAHRDGAEFVTMGHPLMEAVLESVLARCREQAAKGAVFLDPDGKRQGLLWFRGGPGR